MAPTRHRLPLRFFVRRNPDEDGVPPLSVQREFREGLELYRRGLGGEGLVDATVAWARKLAKGEPITPEKARKMAAWFARHGASPLENAARARQKAALARGELRGRAPALVAWLLWGGDSARVWARRLVDSGWASERPLPRRRGK